MDTAKFSEWLTSEKNMSVRSAKDVVCRCGRVCRILNADSIDGNTLQNLLNNDKFAEGSMFIKSQLKRAVTLYLEFEKSINR